MSAKTPTRPIVSLAALYEMLRADQAASERRVMDALTDIENRLVALEDKTTESGDHLDEVRDGLKEQIEEVRRAIDRIDVAEMTATIGRDLDTLADAERRREYAEWRTATQIRRAS
jgi:hypothetical protein